MIAGSLTALIVCLSWYYINWQAQDKMIAESIHEEENDIYENNKIGSEKFDIVVYRFPNVSNSLFSEYKDYIAINKYMTVRVENYLEKCKFGVKTHLTFPLQSYVENGNLEFWFMIKARMPIPYVLSIWFMGPSALLN